MISYNLEMTLNVTRGKLLQILTDPHMLQSITGHVMLHEGDKSGNYDTVLLIGSDKKMATIHGTTVQEYYTSRIGYRGSSLDEKIRWFFVFELRERNELTTILKAHVSFDIRTGFFGSWVKRIAEATPRHIIEDHMKPYFMRLTSGFTVPYNIVEPIVLFSEEGEVTQTLAKALHVAKTAETAVIVIDSGKMRGVAVFKGSKAVRVRVSSGLIEDEVSDVDALFTLLSEGKAKVAVYMFDTNEIIEKIIEHAFTPNLLKSP